MRGSSPFVYLVYLAIFVGFAGAILSVDWGEERVTQTYYSSQPYTFQQSFVRVIQVRNFPWFWREVTQAQYLIRNTDAQGGAFLLNFKFDNGTDVETKSVTVDILAGEEKAVSMDSSLSGESKAALTVVPPNKSIPQQRTVTIKHNGWYYLGRLTPFIR